MWRTHVRSLFSIGRHLVNSSGIKDHHDLDEVTRTLSFSTPLRCSCLGPPPHLITVLLLAVRPAKGDMM